MEARSQQSGEQAGNGNVDFPSYFEPHLLEVSELQRINNMNLTGRKSISMSPSPKRGNQRRRQLESSRLSTEQLKEEMDRD